MYHNAKMDFSDWNRQICYTQSRWQRLMLAEVCERGTSPTKEKPKLQVRCQLLVVITLIQYDVLHKAHSLTHLNSPPLFRHGRLKGSLLHCQDFDKRGHSPSLLHLLSIMSRVSHPDTHASDLDFLRQPWKKKKDGLPKQLARRKPPGSTSPQNKNHSSHLGRCYLPTPTWEPDMGAPASHRA